jgi:replicative DNA helicase
MIDTLTIQSTPPFDNDMERAVLAALLIEGWSAAQICYRLQSSDFYVDAHQCIFEAVNQLFNRGSGVDLLTVIGELRRTDKLDRAGGQSYLLEVMGLIGNGAHLKAHAAVLKDHSIRRQLLAYSAQISRQCFRPDMDINALLDSAITGLDRVHSSIAGISDLSYAHLVQQVVSDIHLAATLDTPPGIPLYLSPVDQATMGMQDHDLVILAARPAMGKTAFMIQAAKRQAEQDIPVGIFSLEMTAKQNILRIIASELRTDTTTLQGGTLSPPQWQALDAARDRLAALPIHICDNGAMTLSDIVSTAKKWKLQHGIRILYVDYLQLISLERSTRASMNREQEISTISRRLKQLAKELQLPVIALSQLSRAVESRADKRPMLSDLRESGAIEQDADLVLFLYRPEYYGITTDPIYGDTRQVCEVIISKFRNGSTAAIPTRFIPQHFRFESL